MYKIVPSEEGVTQEQALEAFNKEYIPVGSIADRLNEFEDQQKKVFGKVAGTINSILNREAKEFGITLEGKTSENVDLIIATYKTKIAELETKYTNALTNPEAKAEIEALNQKLSDQKSLIEKLQGDYAKTLEAKTEIEQNFTAKERELTISTKLEKAKSGFLLIEDMNTRDACNGEIKDDYKFELDEEGNEVVRDQSGKIIVSTAKQGAYADYKEVLNSIYTKRNAHRKVQGGGDIVPKGITETTKVLTDRVILPRS
ncbi:MAG: hypothetical protein ACK459_15190 [Akkermansiaceae bacterium]|jgi:hypothetical protein